MKQPLIVWSLCLSLLTALVPAHAAPAKSSPKPAAGNKTVNNCSWDSPGHNPFMGDLPSAVDRYTDIPPDVRARLKQRMTERKYDEMVTIRRDSIVGKDLYHAEIRDMHFGTGSVCNTVTRDKWAADAQERGLVYCESGHCILVPTVCRNVSRIARAGGATAAGPGELEFDPPAAGETALAPAPETFENLPPTGAGTSDMPATGLAVLPSSPGTISGPIGGPSFGAPPLGGPIAIPTAPLLPSGSLPSIPAVPPPVPEPGTWALMLGGVALLALLRKRRLAALPIR